ncbi:MAG: TetR/AcrR family transcriptional regulator [Chitinophagaceae bacterium]|nr:MAG: TetR/AcrR family transcriptional regulator [Chitinophagaceae bacterium]
MEPKERILVKAEELFLQFGIRSVSMDDIANSLGMSKKTVYQYYADKDELVDAVIDSHISEIEMECLHCKENANDAVHEIFLTLEHIAEELNNMNPMLLYDLEKFHFKAYQRFKQYKDKFLAAIIRKNIEWGISQELYRPEINIDVITKFRLESIMIPFNVSVFPPGKYNLAALSEEIIQHFTYGLVTIKGHKLIQKYNQQRQKNLNHEENKK